VNLQVEYFIRVRGRGEIVSKSEEIVPALNRL
jgi:hypothetical protein